jgi:hypothetical protein
MTKEVPITLSHDEALVLFDLLSRWIEEKDAAPIKPLVEHDGELWSLNSVLCLLERELGEQFSRDYGMLVGAARASLVERCGSWPK